MTTRYAGDGLRNALTNANLADPGPVDDGFQSNGEHDTAPADGDNVVVMGPTDMLAGAPEAARRGDRPKAAQKTTTSTAKKAAKS